MPASTPIASPGCTIIDVRLKPCRRRRVSGRTKWLARSHSPPCRSPRPTALTAPGSPFEMEERAIRGVRTRVWKNAPPTLRDVFLLGRAYGERKFLVYDERATYEAFARAALAIAAALQEDGVGKGDRVAIIMRNLPEWPVAFFGACSSGHRHAAERLVDRAGAGIRPRRFRRKIAIVDASGWSGSPSIWTIARI